MGRHTDGQPGPETSGRRWIIVAVVVVAVIIASTLWFVQARNTPAADATSDRVSAASSAATTPATPTPSSTVPSTPTQSASPASSPAPATAAPAATTSTAPEPRCAERPKLWVGASPAMAEVLTEVAEEACVALEIQVVTGTEGAKLLQDGQIDVWVPESREVGAPAGEAAFEAPAVSWSPVVLVSEPATAAAVSANGPVPLAGVIAGQGKLGDLPVGVQATNGAILASARYQLQAATAATGDRRLALAALALTMRNLGLATDPETMDEVDPGTVRLVEARLAGEATIIPTADGYPVLEAPWLAAEPDGPTAAAQRRMLEVLSSPEGQAVLAGHGLVPAGGDTVTVAEGISGKPLTATDLETSLLLWSIVGDGDNLPGRTLAVLDISGSMDEPSGPTGATAMEGVRAAMPMLVGTLGDETKLGVWFFGNQLGSPKDWVEMAPMQLLADNRADVLKVATEATSRPTGTSLNATVLDAYRAMLDGYDPERVNIIGLLTDGRNEDAPYGIELDQLKTELQAIVDPQRPIMVLCFAFGNAEQEPLREIVAAAGGLGSVFVIEQPEQILGALIEAKAMTLTF